MPGTESSSVDWRNRRAFGFDLLSDPVRTAAATKARDENRAVMTEFQWLFMTGSWSRKAVTSNQNSLVTKNSFF